MVALDSTTRWLRLEVLETVEASAGKSVEQADEGYEHFRATFREGRHFAALQEASRFRREAGRWYYLDASPTVTRLKPGRNDACVCGSGRKSKVSCGSK